MTTLNDALVQIIQSTQGAVEKGIGFLSEQIPDVVQQLLLWKFVESLVWGSVGILILVLVGFFLLAATKPAELIQPTPPVEGDRYYRKPREEYKDTFWRDSNGKLEETIMIPIGTSVVGIIIAFFFLMNLTTALQIYVAPKVFLIEYASHLVK